MDRRKLAAVLVAAMLAAGILLPGCLREPQSETYPLVGTWTEGMRATDEQAQLARDMGCPEEQIRRMQEEGMSRNEFQNVAYARWGLDHLSWKFDGQAFRALWLAKPTPLNGLSCYTLAVEVVGGPFDGEKVELDINEYGAMGSDYWAMLHEEDWEDYVEGVLAPVAAALPEGTCVVAANAGTGGSALGSSDAFEDHVKALLGDAVVYVLPSAEMADDDYDALVEEVVGTLAGSGANVRLEVARLSSAPEGVDLPSEEWPWKFVEDDTCERVVDVDVSYSGEVRYYVDEREAG